MPIAEALTRLWDALPIVGAHFFVALATWAVAALVLLRATPADELRLIREGNVAAGIWVGGTLVALALPIAAAMKYSQYATDVIAWSLLAALVQMITYVVACLLAGKTRARLEQGDVASATAVAATQIAVGLITAAALSG